MAYMHTSVLVCWIYFAGHNSSTHIGVQSLQHVETVDASSKVLAQMKLSWAEGGLGLDDDL
jgi:hypothetical protein